MASLVIVGFVLATYELNIKYKEHKKKKAYKALQKSQPSTISTTDNKRKTTNSKTSKQKSQFFEDNGSTISKSSIDYKVDDEW